MLPTEIIPTERPTESHLAEKKHGCEGGVLGVHWKYWRHPKAQLGG
jgi:hypothetical protein